MIILQKQIVETSLSEPLIAKSRILLKNKWHDIPPSKVTHTQNSCSAFNPSKVHTHSSEHTHTVNTHPEQWAAIYAAAPGEQLGVRCRAQGHLSHGIEAEESAVHSLTHLQFLPTRDSNSQPFDYETDSLTIRPQLPPLLCPLPQILWK